jgi:hypothetical protein
MSESAGECLSTVFDVLSHARRRRLIFIMAFSQQREMTIRYLAELLAVFETGSHPRAIDASSYEITRQSLIKTHLDVLQDADVIERNSGGNMVSRGPAFQTVRNSLFTVLQQL